MATAAYTTLQTIMLFTGSTFVFIALGALISFLLRPHRPNVEKLTTYESGEAPIGPVRGKLNSQFYGIALIFLLFEVEVILFFPWAVVLGSHTLQTITAGQWLWFALLEASTFMGILALSLIYICKKGYLNWPKPMVQNSIIASKIPLELYQQFNRKNKQ